MTPGRSDAVTVTYRPVGQTPRRVRFEPRPDENYERIEEEWTGCAWRPTGREVVTELDVNAGAEVLP